MKILFYTDVHLCESESLVRARGLEYTARIENCVESVNWAEQLADQQQCDLIICGGDFFDKAKISAEEVTAATHSIKCSTLPHYMIVGNHEMQSAVYYNTLRSINSSNIEVVSEQKVIPTENADIVLLPYIPTDVVLDLKDYLPNDDKKKFVFSHNDISGIQYGQYMSTVGIDVNTIDDNCELFVNGHIHNGGWFSKSGINLGNLTGKNFTEDAFKYKHQAAIIDTNSGTIQLIDNPHAFNFYKINIKDDKSLKMLANLGKNDVVSITSDIKYADSIKQILEQNNLKFYRISYSYDSLQGVSTEEAFKAEFISQDHITQYITFAKEKIDNSPLLLDELQKIFGGTSNEH